MRAAELVLLLAVALGVYTYVGYPAVLKLLSLLRRPRVSPRSPSRGRGDALPRVSIVLPVYNEAAVIAATLERILGVDYPADRRQIGVVSARDVSVTNLADTSNGGEGTYVGYEMGIRALETAVDGIVGASGCLYAIRSELHRLPVPDALSRDFAAALTAREHGFRAVSVPQAICYVPRGRSLHHEYRRKVRTITRGLATLASKRGLLNPFQYGRFAWMLASHKVCRWLVPWAAVAALGALVPLALTFDWARLMLAAAGVVLGLAGLGWLWPGSGARILTLPAYAVAGNVGVLQAWLPLFTGRAAPVWEPTRRDAIQTS